MWKFSLGLVAVCGTSVAMGQVGDLIDIQPGVTGGDVDSFTFAPDGQSIIFVGGIDNGLGDQVYSVGLTGGPATLLSDPAISGEVDADVVTDGLFAYYEGDGNLGNSNNEIWRARLDGTGSPTQITENIDIGFSSVGQLDVINRGRTLLYLKDGPDFDGIFGLDSDGGSVETQLTPDGSDFDRNQWVVTGGSRDSQSIIGVSNSGDKVWNIVADGSRDLTEISPIGVESNFEFSDIKITSDDEKLVFTAQNGFDGAGDDLGDGLYTMDLATNSVQELFAPNDTAQDIDNFAISGDDSRVAFAGDIEDDGINEVFVMKMDGTGFRNLTPDIPSFADVDEISFSPDGEWIYFTSDTFDNGAKELFRVRVPAPSTLALAGLALSGVSSRRRR